jgi:hypothetical protein
MVAERHKGSWFFVNDQWMVVIEEETKALDRFKPYEPDAILRSFMSISM